MNGSARATAESGTFECYVFMDWPCEFYCSKSSGEHFEHGFVSLILWFSICSGTWSRNSRSIFFATRSTFSLERNLLPIDKLCALNQPYSNFPLSLITPLGA